MQTIREAKIVIHLEQGKVELKAPDLSKVLADQQRQIDLAKQLEEQLKRVGAAQQASSGGNSGGGSSGGGGSSSRLSYEEREHQKILNLMKQEEQAIARLRSAMSSLGGAAQQAGEGFFRLARAAALLGSSNESLEQMVKNLAEVQAYWDLMSGTIMIVQGLVAAQKALAAAQASYIVALEASTLATQVFMVATIEATAAVVAFALPIVAVSAVVVIAVAAMVAIWDFFTTSQAEATKASQELAAQIKEDAENAARVMSEYLQMLQDRITREQELKALIFDRMTAEEQAADIAERVARGNAAGQRGQTIVDEDLFGGAKQTALEIERRNALDAIRALMQQDELKRKELDTQKELLDAQLKSIEAAEKDLEIAKQKERSFQIQFGMLQQFEQEQLKAIADRLRAGQDINQFEEQFLRENGGEGGRNIADARSARRGAAAGANDVFAGIPDAMDTAAKSVDELEKVLADLLVELKKGGSAIEAKARIEAEKKELQKQYEDFFKGNTEAIRKLAAVVEDLNKKIDAVALATQVNG
jgi:hypothetical protein